MRGADRRCCYMLQPLARLGGRLRHGLAPWRRRSAPHLGLPVPAHAQHLERALAVAPDERAAAASRRRCARHRRRRAPRRRLRPLGPRGARRHARRRCAHAHGGRGARRRAAARALPLWPRFSRIGLALVARSRVRRAATGAAVDGAGSPRSILATVRAAGRRLGAPGLRDRRRRAAHARSTSETEHADPRASTASDGAAARRRAATGRQRRTAGGREVRPVAPERAADERPRRLQAGNGNCAALSVEASRREPRT